MKLSSKQYVVGSRVLIFTFLFSLTSYFLLPTTLLSATNPVLSSQIEAVRREREVLVEEQRKLQAELNKLNLEGQTLGLTVKSLDATRKKLASDIKLTQSKIKTADLSIQVLESSVAETEVEISTHEKAIATALQNISEYDKRSLALNILSATDLSALWLDHSELLSLSTSLDNAVGSLRDTKTKLTLEKTAKEKQRKEILSLSRELKGQEAVVVESRKAKERLLSETKNKEAIYQQMLADNLIRQKQFEEDLYKLESALNLNIDPSLLPERGGGVLAFPLDTIFVTQRFGKTAGAERLYASGSHNGVDLRASQGTRVLAMKGGVVSGAGNTDEQRGCGSYGRWILIKHDNGLSSVYSHLSGSLVSVGQEVKTGDVIGYSGGTPGVFGSGYSTGPHLHIGLFATQGVQVRQFVESRGCKQVVVPIADVRAYLDPLAYLPAI